MGGDAGPVGSAHSEPSVGTAAVAAEIVVVAAVDDDVAAVAAVVDGRAQSTSLVANDKDVGRIYATNPASCATRSRNRM